MNAPTGRITSLAVDPSNASHWLLGSAGGGVWNSLDGGTTWAPLTDSQASLSVGSIAFAAGTPAIYAGTGEATYAAHAQAGQGVLKSTDGGTSWTLVGASTFARTAIGVIRVNPSNPNTVEAVMSRANAGRDDEPFLGPYPPPFGVQLSTDGGVTWNLTLAGESTTLEIDPTNFNNQFTAISLPSGYGPYNTPAPSGLYRSTDGGQTWASITGPWSGQSIGRIILSLAPSSPNTLYASVQGGNQHLLGLYRTDNAWTATPTWIQVSTSGNWSTFGSSYTDYCGTSCTPADMIAVDPSDPNTLYAGGASLWRCSSCGATPTWTDIGYKAPGSPGNLPSGKRCLAWLGSVMVVCTDGGLFSSPAGGFPWQDQNGGLSVARLVSGALHPANPNFLLAGVFDNATALWTGGLAWQSLQVGNAEVALSTSQPNADVMTSSGETIYRSTNGGQSFAGANGGFASFVSTGAFLPVRKCPAIDDVFLTGTTLAQRSDNFFSGTAASWSPNGPSAAEITAIAFAASDAKCNTYAYGTTSGQVQMTVDGGSTWTNLDPNSHLPGRAVNSLAFDPANANIVYAAVGGFNAGTTLPGHLFKTGNALSAAPGWSDVSPAADLPFNVVAVDPANVGSVYVGTDAAVWYSPNGGMGWQFLGPSSGLPNVPVYDLKINPATNRIVAFTFGRGAWTLDRAATPPSGPLPALPASADLQATLGSAFSTSISAGGTAGLTYSIWSGELPLGLTLSSTGAITGTPLSAGVYTFTVLVANGTGGMASQLFTLTVGTTGAAPVWTTLGPSPLSYSNAPQNPVNFNAGRVSAIAVDPGNANHWLVAFGNGGIWASYDAGTSWAPTADSAPTMVIGALAFAPGSPAIIYAGTGEATGPGFTRAGLGMLKSTDGGKTWALLAASTFARAAVRRIRVSPTDPNTVVATVSRGGYGRDSHEGVPGSPPFGIVRSTDGGATWTRTLSGFATALEIDPTNFNNQYAAIGEYRNPSGIDNDDTGNMPNGLYRSTDGGQTWAIIAGPWGVSTVSRAVTGRIELAVAPSNRNVLYASITAPSNGGTDQQPLMGLYQTANAWAATPMWIQVPTGAAGEGGYCGPDKCDYAHVLSVDPSDSNTLMAGGAELGLWVCTNCGSSPVWTQHGVPPLVHSDQHALVWSGNMLILGCDGGVWSTTDLGKTWRNYNAAFSIGQFYSGALHPTDPQFMLGGMRDDMLLVRTATNLWSIVTEPVITWGEAEVALSSQNPETSWMGAWIWGAINRTSDGGKSLISANNGIDLTAVAFVAPVRKCPNNDDVFVTGTNRLWRSNNFFSSAAPAWSANSPAATAANPNSLDYPQTVLTVDFVPSDATCSSYAYGNRGGQVMLTRDGGVTWTDMDPGKTLPARPVNSIAFDPTNANIAYAAISSFDDATPGQAGHVFKTANAMSGSPSWSNIGPQENQPFNVMAVDPVNPQIVYAGSDIGLWRSMDGGGTWTLQGASVGVPNTAAVHDIKINPATGRTVAFTYGRGAFALGPELVSGASSPANGATYVVGGLVPGSWAQVQGRNLAGLSRIWGGSDFAPLNNTLPTNLSGVQVTVNGVPAAVYYVSPTQITFQVPDGITGTATVQVLRDGVPSNTITGTAVANSPGIFPVIINGVNYPAAVFLDGTLAGNPSIGLGFRNARPGDVVQLYATALAPSPAGVPVSVQTVSGVMVTLGNVTFPADSAALVGPGEFQINFTVPQQFATLAAGNYPISIQFNGTSSPTTINSNPPGQMVLPIQP